MRRLATWFRGWERSRRDGGITAVLIALSTLLVAKLAADARIYTIDSYIYLAKARSLIEGHGMSVPWNDGIDRKFFWGYSVALALPVGLFGEKGFVFLACILHVSLGVTFAKLLRLVEPRASVRVLALGLLVFNPLLVWWSSVPASEPLFALLVLAAIFQAIHFRRTVGARRAFAALVAAALAGCAMATRAEGVLIAPVLMIITAPRIWRERRALLALACVAIAVVPEAAHVAYLHAHALSTGSASAYLDELRGHKQEIELLPAAWENIRAPFWTIFRFDTEPEMYEKFFPAWLVSAQAAVAYVYLTSIAFALLSGVRHRSAAFFSALAVCGYALIHGLWYYRYERFMTVMTPFAALALAASLSSALRFVFRKRLALQGLTLVACGAATIVTCLYYGTRVAQMHEARLITREQGRDYRELAQQIDRLDPSHRPIVTDLGPYLAFYTEGRHVYLQGQTDFYANATPWCEGGREFLVAQNVSLLVSKQSVSTNLDRLDLDVGDYDQLPAKATLLMLHIKPHPKLDLSDSVDQTFSSPPTFGGKLALEHLDMTASRSATCGNVQIKASAKLLKGLAAGDELFVHAVDVDEPSQRLNVEPGVLASVAKASDGSAQLDETFVVQIPPGSKTRRLDIWIGLWNSYSGTRLRLQSGEGKRDDNRLLAGELPVSLR